MRGIEIHRWERKSSLVVLFCLGTGQAWARSGEVALVGWFRAPHAAIDAWHINCRWLAREFSGHVQFNNWLLIGMMLEWSGIVS